MKKYIPSLFLFSILTLLSDSSFAQNEEYKFEGENHLNNIRMLTHGGENAEAYLSFDETKLIYQSTVGDMKCDQIFTMKIDGSDKQMVSTGNGRT
ncbi:MAG: hypothetical protein OQK56_08230, partial [Ignavibacteriaceae bacterium]|nr:hypothetical protein [Ignavibacteriaceae bacterium]